MEKVKYVNLAKDMMIFVLGIVLSKLVQFFLMPVYTTYLSVDDYGIAELTNNFAEFLFPIATLCIYEAAFRYAIDKNYSKNKIITESFRFVTLTLIIVACLMFVMYCFYPYKYMILLYIILVSYSYKTLILFFIRGEGYSKYFAVSGVVGALILGVATYFFVVFLKADISGYIISISLSHIISTLYIIVKCKVYKQIRFSFKFDFILLKDMLQYSSPLVIYNIGWWLNTISGRYILLLCLNPFSAGVYTAAVKISAVINMAQQAFYSAFQLNNAKQIENKDKDVFFSKSFKIYSAGILIFGSIILSFVEILADITLKKDFNMAKQYLPIILLTAILECLFCFFKTMYTTFKITQKATVSMIVGSIVNLSVSLLLVKELEIWGVCIATLLCSISQSIYRIYDIKKIVSIKCYWSIINVSIILLCLQVYLWKNAEYYSLYFNFFITLAIAIINYRCCKEDLHDIFEFIVGKIKDNVRVL